MKAAGRVSQTIYNFLVLVLVAAVLAGIGWLIYEAIDRQSALLGTALTALAAIVAVFVGRWVERQTDAARARREHLAPIYEDLIARFTDAQDQQRPVEELLRLFQRKVLIWGPGSLIASFQRWRASIPDDYDDEGAQPDIESFLNFEAFMRAMRSDVGTSNRDLAEGDLMRVLINDFDEYYVPWKATQTTGSERGTRQAS
jgi:hypothetical protein